MSCCVWQAVLPAHSRLGRESFGQSARGNHDTATDHLGMDELKNKLQLCVVWVYPVYPKRLEETIRMQEKCSELDGKAVEMEVTRKSSQAF